MDEITIKKVTIDEIGTLQEVSKNTFRETFSSANSEENMRKYLEEGFATEKLENELADKNSEFYFAILDQKVLGYLKVNWSSSQTELKNDDSLEIERIYVLKEFHGKKVGQLLYETAMDIAKQRKVSYIWLGVWEENSRAIKFYKKNGFTEFDKHVFRLGDDEQTDLMMKLQLA